MKFVLFFTVLLLVATYKVKPQDCFTVIKVKGSVVLEKNGAQVSPDDNICSNDKLLFGSSESAAVIISPTKGRLVLKPGKGNSGEMESVLKGVLASFISNEKGSLGYKGAFSPLTEFGDSYYLVGTYKYNIDISKYPLSKNNYFYVRYLYRSKIIKNTLPFINDTLLFDANVIFKDGIEPDKPGKIEIYYYDKNLNTSELMSEFTLTVLDESKLKDELIDYNNKLLSNSVKVEDVTEEFFNYFTIIYGRTNEDGFRDWVRRNIK